MNEKEIDYEQYLRILKEIYENGIPFNKLVGMKIVELDLDTVTMEVARRPELIGNFIRGSLHGGVISSVIDVVGGLTASVGLLQQLAREDFEDIEQRFARMGTIDLRVDYLRPGFGDRYLCSGCVLRTGNKVAVTRMEFKNEEDLLIAVGTGTYIVG